MKSNWESFRILHLGIILHKWEAGNTTGEEMEEETCLVALWWDSEAEGLAKCRNISSGKLSSIGEGLPMVEKGWNDVFNIWITGTDSWKI